jgi:hypothetical protein
VLTVVTGPPCSGKSTYVRTHAQPGDVVIDFDNLAQAFGSTTRHGHSQAHQQVTIAARRAAIEVAIRWHHKGANVWIVDCKVSPKRAQAYADAQAEFVTLGADKVELHRRANAERPRRWHRLIEEWAPPPEASPSVAGSREW